MKHCLTCNDPISNHATYCSTCIKDRKKEYALCQKDKRYREKYGITLDQYNTMCSKQDGLCSICNSKDPTQPLIIDYCTETRKIRGLLCSKCRFLINVMKSGKAGLLHMIDKYMSTNIDHILD